MTAAVLQVRDLDVVLPDGKATRAIVQDLSFDLARGEALGLVGSSGAGKSTVGLALLRMLPRPLRLAERSRIRFKGSEVTAMAPRALRGLRGRRIAMVFQEPLLALDPSMRIGNQLVEAVVAHGLARGPGARQRAENALGRVGIPDPPAAMRRFPHEFSGGMRQRALIAAALVLEPEIVIADEPTTALDPTLQAQVLDLLDEMRASLGTSLILISHDLDVVAERCGRALVMDGGRVVETADATAIIGAPTSDAGRRLAAAHRRPVALDGAAFFAAPSGPLLDAKGVSVRYPPRQGLLRPLGTPTDAVRDVTLRVERADALGLVGESGCGKTTLARALLRLGPISGGQVRFGGLDLATIDPSSLRRLRLRMQFIPQDAGASLTPHLTVAQLVGEGIEVHDLARGPEVRRRVDALLDELELPRSAGDALPGELSTGERQRVAIARALAVMPELLVCDEPVASLDAATRVGLLDRLDALRRQRGLALLLISHDLAAIRRIASRVAVMYQGRIVESGVVGAVLGSPRMPYTQTLLAAEPTGDPAARAARPTVGGDASTAVEHPDGCPFFPRCAHPQKDNACATTRPPLAEVAPGRLAACWKATSVTGLTPGSA